MPGCGFCSWGAERVTNHRIGYIGRSPKAQQLLMEYRPGSSASGYQRVLCPSSMEILKTVKDA